MPNIYGVSDQDLDDYGADFTNYISQVAAGRTRQLEQQVQQLGNALHQSKRDAMKAELDRGLPSWRQQNVDAGFEAWLKERDVFSGVTRHQLLTEAWNSNRAENVIAIFRAYANGSGSAPADDRPVVHGPNGYYRTSGPRGQVISKAEVAAFYNDVARGRWNGRDAERRAAEEAIIAAGREGRIR